MKIFVCILFMLNMLLAQNIGSIDKVDLVDSKSLANDSRILGQYEPYSNMQYRFGFGASYGMDSINSNVIKGINHKYGIIFSNNFIFPNNFIIENPVILSYLVPNNSYFKAYFNNIGDGGDIDISALGGYIMQFAKLRILLKAGIGYYFSYIYASRTRLDSAGYTSDIGYAMYNGLSLKMGVELGFDSIEYNKKIDNSSIQASLNKHSLGIIFTYYPLLNEKLQLLESSQATNAAFIAITHKYNNFLYNTFGLNVYYLYRF
ncbi:hypothetical protein DCO58_10085 [Helicobacter saguini]|uniref:Outer membrane beta-barrel protein n=1 Tax=Helicobacter saguini TaxID=1548018 RepID=A0A347VPI2_9HELI|nr:hypothetical protein [Helicobacter saguini]MWV61346.1 hypothetical protein [Helicobacter saguini]MWV67984.1 hypothetical protein [Helicobacter saguini]MWV70548.1 hypothetical protein [Helicobacter saguini]MWV72452.1 hypothetical protein [Helicobacter saguini]TLD94790.1 hypothetical protein LS64_004645 [Helicobacter saguini]